MKTTPLYNLAATRSGDKGDISNVGIIAFNAQIYEHLKRVVTPELVKRFMKELVQGNVTVYPMDNISSLQVVMERALGGGATKTLQFDQTGKSRAALLQNLPIPIPDGSGWEKLARPF